MTSTVHATSTKEKKSHLYLISQDQINYKADREKLDLIIEHQIKLLKESVKLDASDKTVTDFDKKLIDLLQKKLVASNKELGILKTLDLELKAFREGDKIAENKLHF